jgi:hypothetical protein
MTKHIVDISGLKDSPLFIALLDVEAAYDSGRSVCADSAPRRDRAIAAKDGCCTREETRVCSVEFLDDLDSLLDLKSFIGSVTFLNGERSNIVIYLARNYSSHVKYIGSFAEYSLPLGQSAWASFPWC